MNLYANPSRQILPYTEPPPLSGTAKRIRAEVVFGTPSKFCDGFGICMITSAAFSMGFKCPRTHCVLFYNKHKNVVVIEVEKNNVLPAVSTRLFYGSTFFLMEESYIFSKLMTHRLGIEGQFEVPAGSHLLEETPVLWRIYLPIK